MKRTIIIIIISILINNPLFSQKQSEANVVGHVLHAQTGEHLPYISIGLKGTSLGTFTDATGHYNMNHLPAGNYTIVASAVGYNAQEKEITLENNKTLEINFELEEDAIQLNPLVISASKNETNRKEAVSIVNVITPKSFENTGSLCLADGLNFQPGLRVENNCQNCGFTQLRINGLEGPYTQILMDSRAINSALAGVYGLEHIPVNMIERVEVVRGGGSALFGSNAVAGTVNIITKEPDRNALSISNTFQLINGNTPDNSLNLNATVLSNNNKAGVTLFGATRQRGYMDYNGDSFSEIGKLNSKSIGFRGYYRTGNIGKITLEYHAIKEYRRGGNNFDLPPHEADITEQTDHNIQSGSLKYDMFFKGGKHNLQFFTALQYIDRDSYYGSGKDPNAYGTTTDLVSESGAQYTLRMKRFLFMPATFITGVEYSHNALNDKMLGYNRVIDQKVNVISLFLQNEWSNRKLSLLIGGRLDKHNLIDNPVFSPRVSVRYSPIAWLNLRGSYASGYRGPQTFDEDLHVTAVGGGVSLIHLADDLKPEMSHSGIFSVEFSKNYHKYSFLFLIEGFYTDLRNVFVIEEMEVDEQNNLIMERRNGAGAVVAGVNLEAGAVLIKDIQLNLGFTWQSSRYKQPEQWSEAVKPQRQMFRSPSTYGYITGTYTLRRVWDFSLSGVYTGKMLVQHFSGYVAEDMEKITKPFFDLGFKIAYTFRLKENISLQLNAGIKNVCNSYQSDFDEGEFRDAGYVYGPSLPRSYFFGLKFAL